MPETDTVMEDAGVSTQHQIEEELQRQRTQNLNDIELPFTIENVTLMSPGTWNSKDYSAEEIRRAYERTDFSDADVVSLFNEHDDSDSRDWIGEVKDVRVEGGELLGDIDIVTAEEARKLAYGARFGISPKVTGKDRADVMRDFRYDNFSLVLDPAVKTTYINSEQQKNSDDAQEQEVKNITVKSKMSEEQKEELSEEQHEKLNTLVSTVENADVEDLAEIISPFMAMSPEELEPYLQDAMEESSEDNSGHDEEEYDDEEYEDEESMNEEKIASIAKQAAEQAVETMGEESQESKEMEEEGGEDEQGLSVDDIADKVVERIEEMSDDEETEEMSEDDEETEEMSEEEDEDEEKENEAVSQLKEELEEVKSQLQEQETQDKTPNPGSEATGQDEKTPEQQVEEMSEQDLDKGMAKRMLRAQKGRLH